MKKEYFKKIVSLKKEDLFPSLEELSEKESLYYCDLADSHL